jgi:tetratricopeptide (TPR) repeat protein
LLAPLAYKHAPREVARWYQAVAVEQYQRGEADAATQSLETALRWAPDDGRLYLQAAVWKRLAGQHEEALDWCAKARERSGSSLALLGEESENLWSLKRWKEAVRLWKQAADEAAEKGELDSDPALLNSLAYARALADTELEEAFRDIESALAITGPEAALLDTRGYIQYRRGNLDAARRDLDAALERIGVPLAGSAAKPDEPKPDASKPDASKPDASKPDASKPDASKPDATPSKANAPDVTPAATPAATPDATPDAAPAAATAAAKRRPEAKLSESVRAMVKQTEREAQRTRAVLIYHRWLIMEKLGDSAAAAADRRRLESLGFQPDDSLF